MRLLRFLPAALLLAAPAPSRAAWAANPVAAAPVAAAAGQQPLADQQLYVELVLNGADTGTLVSLRVRNGRLLADAAELRAAGVQVGDNGEVDLAARPGFRVRYDAALQRLLLDVPPALLPIQEFSAHPEHAPPALADAGLLLGYDALLQRASGRLSASLWTEQRLFNGAGTLFNTGVARAGGGRRGYLRYDTAARLVDEDRMVTLTAGDLVTGGLAWSGAVRLGGVQLARSFGTRPDLVTAPLPRFRGEAAVPSGVDLLVNGAPVGRRDVAAGPFVLDDLPAVSGAGDVTVVTTDALGRQVATTARFYVAPELLRPGLTDFSVEAGAVRRGYGRRSFAYGRAAASASARHGLTRRLTGEFRAEGARGLLLAGGGLAWSPGRWGAVRAGAAVSGGGRGPGSGREWVAGYSYTSRRVSVGLEHLSRDARFRDLAGFDLSRLGRAVRSDRVSLGAALNGGGSLGAALVRSRDAGGADVRLLSASWSGALGPRLSAFAALGYDVRRGGASGQLRLLLSMGRRSAGAGLGVDPGRGAAATVSYARARASDGGLGYAADAVLTGDGAGRAQVQAGWQSAAVLVQGGAARARGGTAAWAGASGAVIAMAGGVFPTSTVPAAFAVVRTGVAGVPVRYENQPVGVTGRSGALLVSAASPFHAGRYAIDPLDLPAGLTAAAVERRAAVRSGAGAVIHLPVRAARSAVVELLDVGGSPLEPGDAVRLSDGRVLPVGWGGEVVLEDAPARAALVARRGDGRSCRAAVAVPPGPAFQRLGRVACL